MIKFKQFILLLFAILILNGCQDSLFYAHYDSVDARGWQSRDTLVYKLPEVEYVSRYDAKVTARIAQNYEYDNLAFVVKLYEGRHILSTDTLLYNIYDSDGEHKGTGFPFVEHETAVPHQITLAPKKKYKVKITHIMRLDPVPGICDVGVEVGN